MSRTVLLFSAARFLLRKSVSISSTVMEPGMTRVVNIQSADQSTIEEALEETSAVLKNGGVIAIPTDTIYGVATLVSSDEGVERIYNIKGRERGKPLAICVSEIAEVYSWAKVTVPPDLLSLLLPGPVTTVFERTPDLTPKLNPGIGLVGVRIPDHSFIRRLVTRCGSPLALTSANVSNTRSTLSVEEFSDLWPELDLVVDGGTITSQCPESRSGSTVVNLSQPGKFSIIRPGISLQSIVSVLKDQYRLTEVIT